MKAFGSVEASNFVSKNSEGIEKFHELTRREGKLDALYIVISDAKVLNKL